MDGWMDELVNEGMNERMNEHCVQQLTHLEQGSQGCEIRTFDNPPTEAPVSVTMTETMT